MQKPVKAYQWILFDADDTLFQFDAFSGLQAAFRSFDVEFDAGHYEQYQQINKQLWQRYQNGEVRAEDVQQQRFHDWSERLGVSPADINSRFLLAMTEISQPFAGVQDFLNHLHGRIRLGIITNGFSRLQRARLARSNMQQYFDVLVVSEEVGAAKPSPLIFRHALQQMALPDPAAVLMVGDTFESDIVGAAAAGMDTCWLNSAGKPNSHDLRPDYQVSSVQELKQLLLKM